MSLSQHFKTNQTKEQNGIPVEFAEAPNDDGSIPTFIVARVGKANKDYSKALEVATRPHRRQIELKQFSVEKSDEMFMKLFASHVLRGWSNVSNVDVFGEGTGYAPYSAENAIKLFVRLPEIFNRLQDESTHLSNFLDESLEDDSKN